MKVLFYKNLSQSAFNYNSREHRTHSKDGTIMDSAGSLFRHIVYCTVFLCPPDEATITLQTTKNGFRVHPACNKPLTGGA